MHQRHQQQLLASPGDKPRTPSAIPQPHGKGSASRPRDCTPAADGVCKHQRRATMLESKLAEFKAENQLLGQLLQEVQSERRSLESRLAEAHKHLQHRGGFEAAQDAAQENAALQLLLNQQQQQLQEKDARLERSHTLQQELQELVLTLSEQCRQQASALAETRERHDTAQPQQLEAGVAAQHGVLKQGKTTQQPEVAHRQHQEQLEQAHQAHLLQVQQQHERELQQVRQDGAAKLARVQQQQQQGLAAMKQQVQELVSQIKQAAEAEVRRCMSNVERQAEDQLRILEQLDRRVSLLATHSQRLKAAQTKQDPPTATSTVQGAETPAQLEQRYMAAIKAAEQEVTQLRCQNEALALERHEHRAHLAGVQLAEGTHRLRAEEATVRSQRSRDDLIKYVEEVHLLLGANATLQRDNVLLLEQVAAAEQAIKGLRGEVHSLRQQLVAANFAGHVSGTPTSAKHAQPDSSSLQQEALQEAQYLEQQARALLAAARNDQAAAQRALLLQVRRMQALEAMRLADLQELHRLERQVTQPHLWQEKKQGQPIAV